VIVTRRRKKPFPYRAVGVWLALLAVVFFVALFPPTRAMLSGGPLAPAYGATDAAWAAVAAPFHFAAQNELLTDRNRQILALQKQVADDKTQLAAQQTQVTKLQGQVDRAALVKASAPVATAAPVAALNTSSTNPSSFSSSQPLAHDLAAGATPDMRRVAQYWSSMDPDNAAAVVKKLPPGYVARIFALMSPDAVGPVLDALPVAFAAAVTQEDPTLQR
jgi:hypothetical protein